MKYGKPSDLDGWLEKFPADARPILRVLYENEECLSDGFEFYIGDDAQEIETMTRIAKDIRAACGLGDKQ